MNEAEFKVEKVNDALAKCGGDRKLASQLLEMDEKELDNAIGKNKDLKARWGRPFGHQGGKHGKIQPPDELSIIARDLLVNDGENIVVTHEDKLRAKVQISEDQRVREGLEKMGLTPLEIELAFGLQKAGEHWYRESLQVIAAGATRSSIKIQVQIDIIAKRLEQVTNKLDVLDGSMNYSDDRARWVIEEKFLRVALRDMSSESRKHAEVGFKSALIRATIESQRAKHAKRPKPGFVDVK